LKYHPWAFEGPSMRRFLIGFVFTVVVPQVGAAQCAMCRAVLESEGNTTAAEGVNDGIVYLMTIPYILVGVLFFYIYRRMKK